MGKPGKEPNHRRPDSSVKKRYFEKLIGLVPAPWAGLGQLLLDLAGWATAIVCISIFSGAMRDSGSIPTLALVGATLLAVTLVGVSMGLYRQRWRFGSLDEVGAVIRTAAGAGLTMVVGSQMLMAKSMPLSVVIGGPGLGLIAMCSVRYTWRVLFELGRTPDDSSARTIVFGAGEAGSEIVQSLMRNPKSPYLPVALLDDDLKKQRHEVSHVRVMGTRNDLVRVAGETNATTLLIAMPSASAELLTFLNSIANSIGIDVKILPPVQELFNRSVGESDIRDITEADLLGRRQIETDVAGIAGYLRGKRVLVTGAGGSIGSELCRQISQFDPETLYMLDRDESALHGVQMSLTGSALLDTPDVILADIRDSCTMQRIFEDIRPQVVFHAAALKHLPLLESYPAEAVKSNVLGTLNVLEAAEEAKVELFVNISTDKAANPSSVLGYSKRVAERLTANFAVTAQTGTYVSVRFGNVLGSRGSMLPAFKAMIAAGGPVTVTEPNVTRFLMTIPESVQLVIQAGAVGRPGEVLVLDMGDPIRIDDVARMMIRESRKQIEIVYTGLRPGEKLHEELFGDGETVDYRPIHPLISHAMVPPIDIQRVTELDTDSVPEKITLGLRNLTIVEPIDSLVGNVDSLAEAS
jgi:FlaA1/EpsC-like NDP-sugar epimerase